MIIWNLSISNMLKVNNVVIPTSSITEITFIGNNVYNLYGISNAIVWLLMSPLRTIPMALSNFLMPTTFLFFISIILQYEPQTFCASPKTQDQDDMFGKLI